MPSWRRCRGATGLPRAIRAITARKYVQLRQIDVIRLRDTHRSCRDTLPLRPAPAPRPLGGQKRGNALVTCSRSISPLCASSLCSRSSFHRYARGTRNDSDTRSHERTLGWREREREREREILFYFPRHRIRIVPDPTVKARGSFYTPFFIALLMASSARRAISFLCLPRLSPPRFYDPGERRPCAFEFRNPREIQRRAGARARCENDPLGGD